MTQQKTHLSCGNLQSSHFDRVPVHAPPPPPPLPSSDHHSHHHHNNNSNHHHYNQHHYNNNNNNSGHHHHNSHYHHHHHQHHYNNNNYNGGHHQQQQGPQHHYAQPYNHHPHHHHQHHHHQASGHNHGPYQAHHSSPPSYTMNSYGKSSPSASAAGHHHHHHHGHHNQYNGPNHSAPYHSSNAPPSAQQNSYDHHHSHHHAHPQSEKIAAGNNKGFGDNMKSHSMSATSTPTPPAGVASASSPTLSSSSSSSSSSLADNAGIKTPLKVEKHIDHNRALFNHSPSLSEKKMSMVKDQAVMKATSAMKTKPQQLQPQPQPQKKLKHLKLEDFADDDEDDEDDDDSGDNDENGKVKRSRHMPLACPFHYLSHTRCDTKTCATRKLYNKNTSPLHDFQYRALKTLYSNHKPNRTFFMKRVKILFRQFAPNGQRAFDELLKELKQQHIVNQSEIDQCIQQEQEQLQHKRKSPKSKKKSSSLKLPTTTTGVPLSNVSQNISAGATVRVKKPKTCSGQANLSVNSSVATTTTVGSKRKMDQLTLLAQQQQLILQQLEMTNSTNDGSAPVIFDGLDFDPALLADYGRTYNTRNRKKRKVEERVEETSSSESEDESEDEKSTVTIQTPAREQQNLIIQEPTLTPNSATLNTTQPGAQDKSSFIVGVVEQQQKSTANLAAELVSTSLSGTASESRMPTVHAPTIIASTETDTELRKADIVTQPSKETKMPCNEVLWYEYDADKCDHQVLVQNKNGDWIVQENGGHKFVDMEDDDDDENDTSYLNSDDDDSDTEYHCHSYHPSSFPENEFAWQSFAPEHNRETDIAQLLVMMGVDPTN